MQILSHPVSNVLRNLHRKQPIPAESLEAFQLNLIGFLDKIKNPNRESHQENDLRDFLNESFYKGKFYFNKKDNIDFVIHNGNEKSKVGVIIEVKKSSEKNDMVSEKNPNVKALHQLMLYYMEERINHNNHEIRHLIVTNCNEWYIFNEVWFNENIFTAKFKKIYQDWKLSGHGTDDFYKFQAKPYLENLEKPIEFYKIDLREYADATPKKISELYKILSPEHLLKQEIANDANKLNKPFYNELLYILGIEDRKANDSNKRIIDRIEEKNRQDGSLIENTINKLKLKDCLSKIPNLDAFGETYQEQLYSVALELCITWLNRILFLKLLEAQSVKYHDGDKSYQFLNYEKITDFDELAELFFEVLAIPRLERSGSVNLKYGNIPYLNSSLFELSELEKATISIEDLKDRLEIKIADSTVLVNDTGKSLKGNQNTLKYLFGFLDAYNYGSDVADEVQKHDKLINAAVLGLIFEKLNGYKDGSFYTPAFITMYMCRETIRRAVVQKFNEVLAWNCEDFDELKDRVGQYVNKENRAKYNALINTIRICDPAVGSGHFLVSALNELIAIKAELNILQHPDGRSLSGLNITIENDELIVFDENEGKDFEYKVGAKGNLIAEKQLIQETLFEEKRTIIENCLFGVDINPKSVKICQLRLWIELLKNAYYLADGERQKGEKETGNHLETLPNIDINIKTGNSLVSKYALDQDLSEVFLKQKFSLQTYQDAVYAYKETRSKTAKTELKAFIDEIKEQFKQTVANFDPKRKRLKDLLGKRLLLENNIDLFGNKSMDDDQLDLQKRKLDKQIADLETEINDVTNSKIYRNSFEWRFEFPEVLDDKGNFVGFDMVIGNPPYIPIDNFEDIYKEHFKKVYPIFERKYETSAIFIHLGLELSKKSGILSYISTLTWQTGENYYKFRKHLFTQKGINRIINLPFNIFEDAFVDTAIYFIGNTKSEEYEIYNFDKKAKIEKIDILEFEKIKTLFISTEDYRVILDYKTWAFLVNFSDDEYKKLGEITKSTQGLSGSNFVETQEENLIYNMNYFSQGIVKNYSFLCTESYLTDMTDKKNLIQFYESEPKILIRRIINRQDRLDVSYTDKEFVFKKDINPFIPVNESISAKYLLAIVASKLISYIYLKSSAIATKDDFRQTTLGELRNLPIRDITKEDQLPFIERVDKILALKSQDPKADTSVLEEEIDEMVFDLYELTEEERKVVKGE